MDEDLRILEVCERVRENSREMSLTAMRLTAGVLPSNRPHTTLHDILGFCGGTKRN
jgi:hypothetical protein